MKDYQNLVTNLQEGTLLITINRENKLNALNKETLHELHDLLNAAFSGKEVKGIILTGAGEKAFVAGADIAEFSAFDTSQGKALASEGQSAVFDLIEGGSKPVIAAINGYALGGGLELAMACHLRLAASHAKMGLPEVSLGLIPGYGGTQRLTQLVGKGKALEMILTADMIDAAEAYRIGLVNQVVLQENLLETAHAMMRKIRMRSPMAVAAAIRAINASATREGFTAEIDEFGNCFGTADFKEGVAAFNEKRKPDFKN